MNDYLFLRGQPKTQGVEPPPDRSVWDLPGILDLNKDTGRKYGRTGLEDEIPPELENEWG